MYCSECGTELPDGSTFCSGCGARLSVGETLRVPRLNRPALISLLAILNFVSGGLALLAALLTFAFIDGQLTAIVLVLVYGLVGGLQIACGCGLWTLRAYGRGIQIGLSILGLLAFPVGTIIAAVVLWYMFRPHVRILFSGKTADQLSAQEIEFLGGASDTGPIVAVVLALLLIPMCGIISAIAIPNLLNAIDRGKQKRSMADIRSIATAIETYSIDNEIYPHAADISELEPLLEPLYIRTLPKLDGWGRSFIVMSSHYDYVIQSTGKDGVVQESPSMGATVSFDDDIVFSNGQFIQWPEGTEQ